MSADVDPIHPAVVTSGLGDRIRHLTSQLRQERNVQIKATSRILGAAAQIAVNHDRLIDQVVEMVEEDLDQQSQIQPPQLEQSEAQPEPYTAARLKQEFSSLKDAKAHFHLKANSWEALATKLNETSSGSPPQTVRTEDSITQKLDKMEQELQLLRGNMNQVLTLLTVLIDKLP